MLDYRITFESPWYLLLLVLVPIVWWYSYRRLALLGPWRRLAALAFRTIVLILLILALAEAQMVHTSQRLTVIYLLDQSQSIPVERRRAMILYVNAAIAKHRQRDDRAGVIVFGRDAAIEIPPFDDNVRVPLLIESLLDRDFTNLAGAMRLAQASFPEDAAKRIVIVSDGNENIGNALEQARALGGAGVGIDVVPVQFDRQGEVIVERLTLPNDIRRGQPFDMKVVITNTKPAGLGKVPGKLVVRRLAGDQSQVISEQKVELPPGKSVFTVRQQIDTPSFYTYEAEFLPDRPDDDTMRQNNRATAFTHIRGKGQVLLFVDHEEEQRAVAEAEPLRQALMRRNYEVTVYSSKPSFASLAELQQYDTVVLSNVPRENFTDDQIRMLARNTQQLGAGLVMLGGPKSFGAGGWSNTDLEAAMPVDFQIKNAKVVPRGALAMLMHACEIPEGNHWQQIIAEEALKALGDRDYCGVVYWSGSEEWLWKPGLREIGNDRQQMLARIDRMTPGDMPDFDPGLRLAQKEFARVTQTAVRHMIVISDGDPSPPSNAVVNALIKLKVTVSTVAVGAHGPAESKRLADLATATGGKYYKVNNPRALPRIFQREARRVAQPLIYENSNGVQPQIRFPHEILSGIDGPLPPINGFVMTTVKDNPLVEVSLLSPLPPNEKNATILASWTYGLGRAVAFTSDTGARWAHQWSGWPDYDKFFGQLVGWSMRPSGDEGSFTVSTEPVDGQVRVVVTALDKKEEFLNFLNMSGTVVGPSLDPVPMKMEQTAPGRYIGTFPARKAGSYFLMISPGAGRAPIRTGVDVPYSDEFRAKTANLGLMEQLAELKPKGGAPGKRIDAPTDTDTIEPMLAVNSFRHDLARATSRQDIWFQLVFAAACLFFFDIFVRRVQISFAWVPVLAGRAWRRVLGRTQEAPQAETIERLRSRKAELTEQVDRMKAATRFEPVPGQSTPTEVQQPASPPRARQETSPTPENKEEDSYTSRLLKAKKKAWEDRDKPKE